MKNQKQNRQHHLESIKFRQGKELRRCREEFSSERFGFSQFFSSSSSSSFYSSVVQNFLKCVCAMVLAVLHAEICSQFFLVELMLNKILNIDLRVMWWPTWNSKRVCVITQHAGLLLALHVYLHQSLAAMPVVTKTDVYAKIPTQNNDMKVEEADAGWLGLAYTFLLAHTWK